MITSADHKDVAKILMVGSGGFLFLAALELLLMRLQLAIPENTFMEPVTCSTGSSRSTAPPRSSSSPCR